MYSYLKSYRLLSAILLALGMYIPSAALAQSEAPIDPVTGCESAGGVWDSSGESLCAPCSLCISNTGEVREDGYRVCTAVCEPWCRCPEGLIFDGYIRCLAPEELLTSCVDETPEAVTCLESGGFWSSCIDTCTYCMSDSGEKVMLDVGCPEVCEEGCNCPEGQSSTPEGCKPNEEVLPSCDGMAGGADADMDDEGDEGSAQIIEDDNSCDQNGGQAPLYLVFLALSVLLSRRTLERA